MTKLTAKPVIKEIYSKIADEISTLEIKPKLVVIILGEDPAAMYYVGNLEKRGNKIGISVTTEKLALETTQEELKKLIFSLNRDDSVSGIMIQKPLPAHIDEDEIVMSINPDKDVDGFHPVNMGNLVLDRPGFLPSTPASVLEILRFYDIETSGKNVVILGRSNIVGKPLANLMLRKNETGNATVTICHSRTAQLAKVTEQADILVAAIGRARFVSADMIKDGAIVIDVGINQIEEDGKIKYVGDVDFDGCVTKASNMNPVPGGVGSVTTALLLKNVLKAYKIINS